MAGDYRDIADQESQALADEPTPEIEQVAESTSRKLLVLLAIGAVLLILLHFTPIGRQVRDWDSLAALLQADDLRAELYFVLISSFMIMAGTPRLLFYSLAGFAFGFWEGLFWAQLATLIGSFVTYRAARWGGKDWLTYRFGKRRFFRKIVDAQPTVASVALMRMLPVSNVIINAALAISRVDTRAFLLGSFVGFLPQGVVAVIVGSGVADDVPWAGAVQIGVAGVLLLVVYLWTSRKHRERR